MTQFITIQNTYTHIEIGLYEKDQRKTYKQCTNKAASKELVPLIIELLDAAQEHLNDCAFIAVNQGPGPFTTLRVVLATVNGISIASRIPLIGIDGLHAFLDENKTPEFPVTIALLNAFNQEIYYGIQDHDKPYSTGYANINQFLQTITDKFYSTNIRFIGNGTQIYRTKIEHYLGTHALFPESIPLGVSLDALAAHALHQWDTHTTPMPHQLLPLYLKKHAVER